MKALLLGALLSPALAQGPAAIPSAEEVKAARDAYQAAIDRYNAYGLTRHSFADEGALRLEREKNAAQAWYESLAAQRAAALKRPRQAVPKPPAWIARAEPEPKVEPAASPASRAWPYLPYLLVLAAAILLAKGLTGLKASASVVGCPGCGQRLRLPKKKAKKVTIRCPKCRKESVVAD